MLTATAVVGSPSQGSAGLSRAGCTLRIPAVICCRCRSCDTCTEESHEQKLCPLSSHSFFQTLKMFLRLWKATIGYEIWPPYALADWGFVAESPLGVLHDVKT